MLLASSSQGAKVKVWYHANQGHHDKAQFKQAVVTSEGLVVNGVIRASGGIVFADGTVLDTGTRRAPQRSVAPLVAFLPRTSVLRAVRNLQSPI